MSSIRYAPRAQRDLDEIAEYLAPRSPAAAVRFRDAMQDAVEMLHAHPHLGILVRDEHSVRSWLLPGFPYRVHYDLIGGDLVVLHVRHTARRDWRQDDP